MAKKKKAPYAERLNKMVDKSTINDTAIVDKEAWLEWQRLKNSKTLNENKMLEASDGMIVNLGWLPPTLFKKIAHLPEAEQKQIKARKNVYQKTLTRANGMKMAAYGNAFNRINLKEERGSQHSILWTRKEEVIELFGRMFTPEEVHKIVVEEWKLPCSLKVVINFRDKYLDTITDRINNFKREFSDIRLGIKRGRLEELVYLYTVMKEKFSANKGVYEHRALITNLEQIRKEVEGDKILFDGNLNVSLEANVNLHLQQEILRSVNINQIIIGRVAARMRMHPERIIKALLDSYYAKLTGIVQPAEEAEYETVEYPSNLPYDFTEIERVQQKLKDEADEAVEAVVIQTEIEKTMGAVATDTVGKPKRKSKRPQKK